MNAIGVNPPNRQFLRGAIVMILFIALIAVSALSGLSAKFGAESRPGFAGAVDVNSRLS
jgi:hypothetical protein